MDEVLQQIQQIAINYKVEKIARIHDLLRLSERAGLNPSDEQKDFMDLITSFNIAARYPDYKQSFYKKCTPEYTSGGQGSGH